MPLTLKIVRHTYPANINKIPKWYYPSYIISPHTTFFILLLLVSSPPLCRADNLLVQYSFTLQNKTDALVKEVDFLCFLPLETSRQQRLNVTSSYSHIIKSMPSGSDYLQFELTNFAPGGTKVVQVAVTLQVNDHTLESKLESKTSKNDFLKPEKYIESDQPEIIRLAKKLKHKTAEKTVENIYKWVSGNISYSGYAKNMRGALYALQHKAGDCSEYAALFVALCRTNKIPARTVAGFICTHNCILKPSSLHNWAEFQLDNQWRIADPQNRKFMKNETAYITIGCAPRTRKTNSFNTIRFQVSNPAVSLKMNN